MRSHAIRFLAALAAIALAALAACTNPPPRRSGLVGRVPPEIEAEGWINADAAPSLAKLHGKVVVVEFWATWCPPCRKSIPHLAEIHRGHAKDPLVIIGLSEEARSEIEPFVKAQGMPYIVGHGSRSRAAYGVEGIPMAFVVGHDGKVTWDGHPLDPEFERAIGEALDAARKAS